MRPHHSDLEIAIVSGVGIGLNRKLERAIAIPGAVNCRLCRYGVKVCHLRFYAPTESLTKDAPCEFSTVPIACFSVLISLANAALSAMSLAILRSALMTVV